MAELDKLLMLSFLTQYFDFIACHIYVTSLKSVRRPPVMLLDYDHTVQQKKQKFAGDRIGKCLGYLHAQTNPDCNILWS